MKIAIQLYTLRQECAQDFAGTLEQVARLGFQGVELAGTHGMSAAELKGHLDRLGLEVAGAHVGAQEVLENAGEVIAYHREIGNRNIVIPWYELKTIAEADALAAQIRAVSGEYAKNGMRLCYHNHDFEMKVEDGTRLLDRLAEQAGDALRLELDLFWVHAAGVNPAEYIGLHRNRLELVHLKDGNGRSPTALGEGEVDFDSLFTVLRDLGLEWAVLENDNPVPDGISDVSRSRDYLVNRYSSYVSFRA